MWSKYSTTVTFDPSLDQTEPISKPIYPPPITTNFSGTFLKDRAPVEETIFFSSISIPGSEVGCDPVAITIFLDLYDDFLFPSSYTTTSLGENKTPLPLK